MWVPMSRSGRRNPACAVAGVVAVLGLLAAAPAASASWLMDTVGSCDGQVSSQVFLPWGDLGQYVLLPGGDLADGGADWQLSGAQVVADNEPWQVSGPSDPAALQLAEGSAATSPAMCVTVFHPTLRLFARNVGNPLGTLRVDVLFQDLLGHVQSLPIGILASGGSWEPTPPMVVLASLLTLLPGSRTPVAFRFTPQGAGSEWTVDDIYVDPYCKG